MIPTGTVVFVFSDIEGSTIRWEADRHAMQVALRRHDAILSDAIARCGGYVFKTIGDAFCATFHNAREAVDAAVEIQRRLAIEDWSAVDGLRVRMALHTGGADERDGDYFGPTVNRVARLLATAHGGQVILSSVTAKLLEHTLPADLSLRDLGSHVLKDLRDPEHVYQLCAPGLQTEFRRLRSLDARADNLPAQLSSFVGRENELDVLGKRLRDARLVTVLGPGGVGKTRLALRAAEAFVNAAGEACFVDLAPLDDPTLVAGSIFAALGASQSGESSLETLLNDLRSRRILMVFDNCEHVLGEVARIARALAERCADVVVLCTSREPLNVAGEQIVRLAPFDTETAIALFAERATAANRSFVLDEKNRATVAAICERIDSIALAIELAAARLRVISLSELARRLDERFRILTGGSRTALPHRQTMRALIDWSYELLTSDEKTLFERLAAFKGRFTFDAVASVCADEAADEFALLDTLAALVDKSLVIADVEGSGQYRLLQLIEEYARERLVSSGDIDGIAARHTAYYCELFERAYAAWDVAPPLDWLAATAADIDNVRSSLAWALEGGSDIERGARLAASAMPVFLRLSLLNEGIAWCEAALASNPAANDSVRARLFYMASMVYNNQVAFRKTLESASEALALYERCGDERGTIRALAQLARQCARYDRREEARGYALRAVSLARTFGDERLLASSLQRGAAVFEPAEIETARAWFAESVALFRRLGRDDETARALEWWSAAEADAGHVDRALAVSLEGLPLAGRDARAYATNSVASFALVLGKDDLAADMSREAFALATEARHPVLLPLAFTYLAAIAGPQDASAAARLVGYAYARLAEREWTLDTIDVAVEARVRGALDATLDEAEIASLFAEGAAWDEARAILAGYRI